MKRPVLAVGASMQRALLLVLGSAVLVGCVTVPKVEYARGGARSVALLSIVEPMSYPVMNIGGPSGMFGLVGGLVQAGLNDAHTKSYTALLQGRRVAFASTLESDVAATLEATGQSVLRLDARPAVGADGRTVDYASVRTDADAIVHVWFTTVGYLSPPRSASFQPWVGVRVRMLDARSRQDLYFKTFACGYVPRAENVVVVVPPGGLVEYDTFDKLVGDLDGSIAALDACRREVVAQVRRDIESR